MDLGKSAQTLIDKHSRNTERLSALLRATARTHYAAGVSDCLRVMQEEALREERVSPPAPQAPLAVQASHSAIAAAAGADE